MLLEESWLQQLCTSKAGSVNQHIWGTCSRSVSRRSCTAHAGRVNQTFKSFDFLRCLRNSSSCFSFQSLFTRSLWRGSIRHYRISLKDWANIKRPHGTELSLAVVNIVCHLQYTFQTAGTITMYCIHSLPTNFCHLDYMYEISVDLKGGGSGVHTNHITHTVF